MKNFTMTKASRVDIFFDQTLSSPRWIAKAFCDDGSALEVFLSEELDPQSDSVDILVDLERRLVTEDVVNSVDTNIYIFPAGEYERYLRYL